jgi:tetratricopeptide (TPR) repeat protein
MAVLLAASALPAGAASFDDQYKVVSASAQTQPESAIIDLLKAGLAEAKPTQAIAATQKWLQQNVPEDPMLLYHAGRAAELSGDLKAAVAIYQQYIAEADLKSEAADNAVYAVYSLLLHELNDTSGAYAFGRNAGNGAMVCPRGRQFDEWFLNEAMRRQDGIAVATRLHACIEAGLPDDLLTARYGNYFRWLLGQVDAYLERGRQIPVTQEFYDAVKDLAGAITFNEEMKLRLDWAISVRAYNLARIGGDGSKQKKKKKKDADVAPGRALDELAPPIAEATALLAKYPRYARWVQDGWAGGGNGQHYRNDPKHYWPHEIEAKMAPIVAAAAKMTELERGDLLRSWRDGYYRDNVVRPLKLKVVLDYVNADPKLTNSRNGVVLLKRNWDQVTPEEAIKLAPQIEQSRDVNASYIRAIAAGGKERDFDKMIAALLGPEAWRLATRIDMHYANGYRLHKFAGDKGGKDAQKIAGEQMNVVAKKIKADPNAEAPSAERMAMFKKLWADYQLPQPKEPAVYDRLVNIMKATPEAVAELLKDPTPEAQQLARSVLAAGVKGQAEVWTEIEGTNKVNVNTYAPGIIYLAQRHARGSIPDLKKRYPKKCVAHPLEPVMRQVVADGLKQNKLQPWQVMAWINMQYPENNDAQVELMQALLKAPVWKTMPFEVQYGARQWFENNAMTPAQWAWIEKGRPATVCKDLISLAKDADAETTSAALAKAIDAHRASPIRFEIPAAAQLGAIDKSVFQSDKVLDGIAALTYDLRALNNHDALVKQLIPALQNSRDDAELLHRAAPALWNGIRTMGHHYLFPEARAFVETLLDTHPSAATAHARYPLRQFDPNRKSGRFDPSKEIPLLRSVVGKGAMKMGLVVIPVARNHAAYPVYKSQAEWMTANENSAWDMLDENWEQLLPIHRNLSTPYLTWALQRAIYSRDEARQEELATALLDWAQGNGSPWSVSEKIDLEIAYGDIAMQMGRLEAAHKIFTATQRKEGYAETPERHKATLRRVRVERIAKRFDDALKTLADLDLERIPEMWAPSRYARAEVYYDMEEFDDAADDIDAILAREPDHAEAKIMQGKVQLKRKKLMEASELDVGSKDAQKTMVPGEDLKVTLSDPTLAVSGAGTEIEVVVTATSGDKETFFLRQFGDEKTKFRGEVRTALGKPNPGDRILQVIGDDKIYYAYSERFRKKMNDMEAKQGGPITVKSDGILMASARRLLTDAEQRIADMQKEMDAISRGGREKVSVGTQKVLAARKAIEKAQQREVGEASDEADKAALAKELLRARVKPGKAINVRIIDPDRSRTADVDELVVSVESSSGDSISRITLKETETHSGWFEGSIPTSVAQAMAFAENSQPGRNPNMVISPKADYPAWRPVAVKNTKPAFKVDLNDNIELGKLTITAKETGAKVKKFILQTGMNPSDMTTVGVYPKDLITLDKPWHPSVTIMNDTDHHHGRNDRSVYDVEELTYHLDQGWISQIYAAGVAENVAGPSAAMTKDIPAKVKWQRQNRHHNSHVVYRFRGYFHESTTFTRRFKVQLGAFKIPEKTHPSVAHPPQFMLAINGRPITSMEKPGQLEGHMTLRPGVHRFEIWATGWDNTIGFGRDIKLLANIGKDPDELVDCPDSFFDPTSFPKDALAHRNGKATITGDGDTFNVAFADKSRTRLLNLIILDQEGPVPALNKIALTAKDGSTVLPVKEDYAALNKNDKLEILTGDRVAIRYVDDRFVSKDKQKLERFLNVSFSDAGVAFEYREMRMNQNSGKLEPYYERLLRFAHNKPLLLTINDPDMDMSDEPDVIDVTLQSKSGKRTFKATETDPSNGIFRLTVTPVPGAPADDTQIQVAAGDTITAIYRDAENIRPGVPIDREVDITHAVYTEPTIAISHASISPINPGDFEKPPGARGLPVGFARVDAHRGEESEGLIVKEREKRATGGTVRPRWQIDSMFVDAATPPEGGHAAVHGTKVHFDLKAPHLALRVGSTVSVYVQTDASRKVAAQAGQPAAGFDISLPGTMQLDAVLSHSSARPTRGGDWRMTPLTPIYIGGNPDYPDNQPFDRLATFVCNVPLIAGFLPEHGVLSEEEILRRRKQQLYTDPAGLVVKPGEKIHVGFNYTDATGAEKWLTASAKVVTRPVFDILDEDYRVERTEAYVGETLFLRVVDLGADVSDANDRVTVLMQSKSGAKHRVELQEVDPHSGVFQAFYQLAYRQDDTAEGEDYSVRRDGFPVVYDDIVRAVYTDSSGVKSDIVSIRISKGADGSIAPFSKKYDDPEIAMRTQFALAEAFLEMAKRHRKLGERERAEHEYARAKDMLEKAMEMFKDPVTRAQAEYLLGNLTQEEADTTTDPELQEDRYRAALSRYMRVTGSYSDTLPASKAQFKIATVYERLEEPEIAAQEYVKLAYKYPDSEFLALSMARLGTHFQRRAAKYEKEAETLLAKVDDKDAQFDGTAMHKMMQREYIKSAEIFGRLQERFPDHELAGKGGLRAGQAYMRAGDHRNAIVAFKRVSGHDSYDGPTIRAQAMYWMGLCYENTKADMAAYSQYKRLSYDFPESKWASYARGQLSQDKLLNIETDIETKRLEEGR